MKKSVALPKGFEAVTFGSESWKPAKPGDSLVGTLGEARTYEQPKKGKMPARSVNIYPVRTDDGATMDVWESAGLRALENIPPGSRIAIVYTGKKQIKAGQNPMRTFSIGVDPSAPAPRGRKPGAAAAKKRAKK